MDLIKLLFLDIDGVLNSEKFAVWCADTNEGAQFLKTGGHHLIDPEAVKRVLYVCEQTNANIVLSSSWRAFTLEDTKKELEHYRDLFKISKLTVGITPRIYRTRFHRGAEIKLFLNNIPNSFMIQFEGFYDQALFNNLSPEQKITYCIIDDDTDMYEEQMGNFVHIDYMEGFTNENAKQVINILNSYPNSKIN